MLQALALPPPLPRPTSRSPRRPCRSPTAECFARSTARAPPSSAPPSVLLPRSSSGLSSRRKTPPGEGSELLRLTAARSKPGRSFPPHHHHPHPHHHYHYYPR